MDLSLRQLRAFLAVAENGGFTRAAHALNVSQPAITKTIRDIEEEVGVSLFERLPRGAVLTPAGEVLARRARSIAAELHQAGNELSAISGTGAGVLSIGTAPIGAADLVPRSIALTVEKFPGLNVLLREAEYSVLLPLLRAGDLDFVFGPVPDQAPDDLNVEIVTYGDFSIIARAEHPLVQVADVTLADVSRFEWVLPPKELPPRRLYESILRMAGLEAPSHGVETSSIAAIRRLLLDSDRLTMLPRAMVKIDIESNLLAELPIKLRGSQRPIALMYRVGSPLTQQAEEFANNIRSGAPHVMPEKSHP